MYSGPHLAGRVGTAQRTCAVEADWPRANRYSNTYTDTNSESHAITNTQAVSNADSDSVTNSYPYPFRRNLRAPLERRADLPWRRCSQCWQQQLHRGILQPKPESHYAWEQRTPGKRRSLEPPRCLHVRRSYTNAYANPNTEAVSYAHAQPNANPQPDTYA